MELIIQRHVREDVTYEKQLKLLNRLEELGIIEDLLELNPGIRFVDVFEDSFCFHDYHEILSYQIIINDDCSFHKYRRYSCDDFCGLTINRNDLKLFMKIIELFDNNKF
jgi:hypothetical protein